MTVLDVPKPPHAGSGQNAILDTKSSFVNVRSGPGVDYQDIGNIFDNSLVIYYPNSMTPDNWYFVEYRGLSGWIAGWIVNFIPALTGGSRGGVETPYDSKVAVWHWKGTSIPETTIEEFARNLKNRAPNVKMVWVKTSDGPDWQGRFDEGDMAINGPADVARWVSVLRSFDMEFHAWCVPKGTQPDIETSIIADVCNVDGVKSMILDVEPYAGFWQGGAAGVRPYMMAIRQKAGNRFHIGMTIDPRPWHFDSIFPQEWRPFVNSVHPQTYWATFRKTPEESLRQTYETWGGYGLPVVPALQGDAPVSEQRQAHTVATQQYGAPGLSWWRYGVITQFDAVNMPVEYENPGEGTEEPVDVFTDEVLVKPDEEGFRRGTYTGQEEFNAFADDQNVRSWTQLWKKTEPTTSTVWAEWKSELPESGRYEIAVYVPGRHSTTRRARYKVHGIKGTDTEVVIDINQANERNRWVPLGVFDLVKDAPNAGKVFLNDVTGEADKEIAFSAVRFRRVVRLEPGEQPEPEEGGEIPEQVNGVYVSDGFDAPVGTPEERAEDRMWPRGWRDATGFGPATVPVYVETFGAYHPGVDLNWGRLGNDDIGVPVYSPASGIVVFSNDLPVWGNVTVIKHDPYRVPTGIVVYSRYGHMQNVRVTPGQRVKRGQQLGEIGTANGRFVAHLHYDISATTRLEQSPGDWPRMDLARLLRDYVDPLLFTQNNRPPVSQR